MGGVATQKQRQTKETTVVRVRTEVVSEELDHFVDRVTVAAQESVVVRDRVQAPLDLVRRDMRVRVLEDRSIRFQLRISDKNIFLES